MRPSSGASCPLPLASEARRLYHQRRNRHRRPDRWLDGTIPETASSIEAPWAHMATFLAGPRGCIGYRFALLEIKAFLFVLLRSIEFNNPTPALHYIHRTALVQRPLIKDRESEGYQMRLKLSKV